MKISKFSLMGLAVGFLFSLGSFVRYYILYPDFDKALADITIGGMIMAISWLYNLQLNQSNHILAIEDYLADKNEV